MRHTNDVREKEGKKKNPIIECSLHFVCQKDFVAPGGLFYFSVGNAQMAR